MHRTARPFLQPFSRWFLATSLHARASAPALGSLQLRASALAVWSVACLTVALGAGCTLITDVDRSKIPAAEVIPPDPPPPQRDAGDSPPVEDDAGSTPELDAGTPGPDAAAPASDAG